MRIEDELWAVLAAVAEAKRLKENPIEAKRQQLWGEIIQVAAQLGLHKQLPAPNPNWEFVKEKKFSIVKDLNNLEKLTAQLSAYYKIVKDQESSSGVYIQETQRIREWLDFLAEAIFRLSPVQLLILSAANVTIKNPKEGIEVGSRMIL